MKMRAKPLIDDITHKKPAVLYRPLKPSVPYKLSPALKIRSEYQAKLDSNLYADILSGALRSDKMTRLSFPRHFLLKFVAPVVRGQPEADGKVPFFDIVTTDAALTTAKVRLELNETWKKCPSNYAFARRADFEELSRKPAMGAILVPLSIMQMRAKRAKVSDIDIELDPERIESKLAAKLSELVESADFTAEAGEGEVMIALNSTKTGDADPNVIYIDLSNAHDRIKQILRSKWQSDVIRLAYNSQTRKVIQFVHKISIYYDS